MHIEDLSGWRHDHVFDKGNRAGERGTRVVMWITALMMVAEIAAGWFYSMAPVRTSALGREPLLGAGCALPVQQFLHGCWGASGSRRSLVWFRPHPQAGCSRYLLDARRQRSGRSPVPLRFQGRKSRGIKLARVLSHTSGDQGRSQHRRPSLALAYGLPGTEREHHARG